VKVLSKAKGRSSKLFLIGDTTAEFVVQVTDRHSTILNKQVTETLVWPFNDVLKAERGINSAEGAFHSVAHGKPVLRLAVASVDAAVEAMAA
jgi:hypothetical protein